MVPDAHPAATPVRYDYLDALRGWAILGVVAVHAQNQVEGNFFGWRVAFAGRCGVQLFFMVSAFTIFLTLDRARWQGWRTWTEFYIRRFFRILPMFWVGLVLYAFVPGRGSLYQDRVFGPLDYLLTATLQHGWHPALVNSLVPGGWSIAAEGTFYLCVPFCFRLVKSWPAALWFFAGSLVFAVGMETVLGFLYSRQLLFAATPQDSINEFTYCQFFMQLPVFALGMAVYRIARSQEGKPWSRSTGAALLAGAALWLYSVVDIGRHGLLPERIFFSLGFVALMLGIKACPTRLLVNPVTCYLGKVSYSIYLLHFAVLRLAMNTLDTYLDASQQGLPLFLLLFGLTVAGAGALAWLTHRCIERPGIELGARLIRYRRTTAGKTATGTVDWPLVEGIPSTAGRQS